MNYALLVPLALFLGLSISRAEPNTHFTALAQRAASAIATAPALPAMDVIEALAGRLRKQFDTWLEHPDLYAKKALAECLDGHWLPLWRCHDVLCNHMGSPRIQESLKLAFDGGALSGENVAVQ
jgi:hypothetical protein